MLRACGEGGSVFWKAPWKGGGGGLGGLGVGPELKIKGQGFLSACSERDGPKHQRITPKKL